MQPLNDPKSIKFPHTQIEITGSPKDNLPEYKRNKKPHLLSWRRREIENYLFTYSILHSNNMIDDIRDTFGANGTPSAGQSMDGNNTICDSDYKVILKGLLYKTNNAGIIDPGRWDYDKLNNVLDIIPASEISDDIMNMYKFIVSKIN